MFSILYSKGNYRNLFSQSCQWCSQIVKKPLCRRRHGCSPCARNIKVSDSGNCYGSTRPQVSRLPLPSRCPQIQPTRYHAWSIGSTRTPAKAVDCISVKHTTPNEIDHRLVTFNDQYKLNAARYIIKPEPMNVFIASTNDTKCID